jgi:PleD family two-component response regulator
MPHRPEAPAKVMLAIVAPKVELWRRILAGHEVVVVTTLREAMQRLTEEDNLRMVVIGVHFDESRMFTLLGDIRAHPKYRNIPVLVVLSPGQYAFSEIAVEGIDRAVTALGANGFLNLDHFPDNAEGEARIRRIVDHVIATGGDLLNA